MMETTRVTHTEWIPPAGHFWTLIRKTADWLILWKLIDSGLTYLGPDAKVIDGKLIRVEPKP
jgi:hypothetical protein